MTIAYNLCIYNMVGHFRCGVIIFLCDQTFSDRVIYANYCKLLSNAGKEWIRLLHRILG